MGAQVLPHPPECCAAWTDSASGTRGESRHAAGLRHGQHLSAAFFRPELLLPEAGLWAWQARSHAVPLPMLCQPAPASLTHALLGCHRRVCRSAGRALCQVLTWNSSCCVSLGRAVPHVSPAPGEEHRGSCHSSGSCELSRAWLLG